jgi:hypothetical protein
LGVLILVSITGSDIYFTNISDTITATQWETLIDQAIDKINGYAKKTTLQNMSGTAGSKTVTVSSRQAGFIRTLTVAIYSKDFKSEGGQSTSFGLGGLSHSQSSSATGSSEVESLAEAAAKALTEFDWSQAII